MSERLERCYSKGFVDGHESQESKEEGSQEEITEEETRHGLYWSARPLSRQEYQG